MSGTVVFDFDYTLADTARFKAALAVNDDEEAVIGRMPEFVFPDAARVLGRLKKDGWRLALLTFGEPGWQRRKAARSGLMPLFEYAVFTAEPKSTRAEDMRRWPRPLVFVNDHGAEIDEMSRLLPEGRHIAVRGPKPGPSDPSVPVCASLEDVYKEILKTVQ